MDMAMIGSEYNTCVPLCGCTQECPSLRIGLKKWLTKYQRLKIENVSD